MVTVVIVTHNSEHVVVALLASLPDALAGMDAELIVVDSGSQDRTLERLTEWPECKVIRGPNIGYAAGINIGVAASSGEGPILVLNPDLRLEPGAVRLMAETLSLPSTGIVAPRVHDADGRLTFSLRRDPTLPRALGLTFTKVPALSEYLNRPSQYDRPQVVDWALGAVLLVDRPCFSALDGWDDSFFLYSEETDFSIRARRQGWLTRYDPRAHAVHIGKQSGYSNRIHAMQIVNRVRLYRRDHNAIASSAYLLLAAASEGYRAALGVEQSRYALRALLRRRSRPEELRASASWLPR